MRQQQLQPPPVPPAVDTVDNLDQYGEPDSEESRKLMVEVEQFKVDVVQPKGRQMTITTRLNKFMDNPELAELVNLLL